MAPPPPTCPGIVGGVCTEACQRTMCEALGRFFRLTYNASSPWQHAQTWMPLRTTPCSRLIRAGAGAAVAPVYCGWYGIACCDAKSLAARSCWALHSVANLTIAADNVNGSFSSPPLMDTTEQLHACGMVGINLESNDMSGTLSPRWGRLTNLTTLNLANNWISGTVPSQLANLKKLKALELGTNFLAGTIGDWMGDLRELMILNLGANAGVNEDAGGGDAAGDDGGEAEELTGFVGTIPSAITNLKKLVELDLQMNGLTGTLPPDLCDRGSALAVLSLHGNRLSGPATPALNCTQLTSLDLSFNEFTGSLPATMAWDQLVSMKVGQNQFTGQIPDAIFRMQLLTYLDISANTIRGKFDDRISLMIYLTYFDASGNQLTGSIGRGIFFLPQIARLNLANNRFSGTLNPELGFAWNLRELILANNTGLVGRLPDEAASLSHLHRVGLMGTEMSCVPEEMAAKAEAMRAKGGKPPIFKCKQDQLLPCFLVFEKYTIPISDGSGMRCPPITALGADAIIARCPPGALTLTPDPTLEVLAAQWDLPPAYFQYQGCSCLEGYNTVWSNENTVLQCNRKHELPAAMWGLVALAAALFLLALSMLLLGRRMLLFQRRWLREAELKRKRRMGVPKDGAEVSIVITDIEAYSILMKTSPTLATKALSMHNAVLRKAANDNAGHVIDQEGDSWGIAFYDAVDAVAFCLQAQQALHKVDWPSGLMGHDDLKSTASQTSMTSQDGRSQLTVGEPSTPPSRLQQLLGVGRASARSRAAATVSWLPQRPAGPLAPLPSFSESGSESQSRGDDVTLPEDGTISVKANSVSSANPRGGSQTEEPTSATGSAAGGSLTAPGTQGVSFRRDSSQRPTARNESSGRTFLKLLMRQGNTAQENVFFGLRVRMGVATGKLSPGVEIARSGVFDVAKVVSDMANGGQVLVDAETFELVRGERSLLAVDHRGYNDQTLVDKAGWGSWGLCCTRRPLARLPRQRDKTLLAPPAQEAGSLVVLDMGEYEVPGINLAAAHGQAPGQLEGGGRQQRGGRLRVYSVSPNNLAERAKEWGNSLAFKSDWRQTDRGFFEAPAALAAACLTPRDFGASADAMPPVTIVFAGVEGAKWLVRWRHAGEVKEMAQLLRMVYKAALRAVPGGYLCREEEGGLRYMLAFFSPESALQWCLLVQEALMYAPWPAALLALPEFGEQHAPDTGTLLFRGPRVKIGVCEGKPRGLQAGGDGRANYFGACVSQAAHLMDGAAHGGQVACELQLVKLVFSNWRLHDVADLEAGSQDAAPPWRAADTPPGGVSTPSHLQLQQQARHGGEKEQRAAVADGDQPGPPAASRQQLWPGRGLDLQGRQRRGSLADEDDSMALATPSRTLSGTELMMRPRYSRMGAVGAFLSPLYSGPLGQAAGLRGRPPIPKPGAAQRAVPEAMMMPQLARPRAVAPATLEDEIAALPRHSVAVRAMHLGTFVFKGSDALEMVSVTTASLAPREELTSKEEARSGRSRKVKEQAGVADGAVALIPDILPGLKDRFLETAAAAAVQQLQLQQQQQQQQQQQSLQEQAAAAGNPMARRSHSAAPKSAGVAATGPYAAWLSQELARRHLFKGDGVSPPPDPMQMRSFTTSGSIRRNSGAGL